MIRRREFISLLGGAAATWPGVARAQQAERMRHVGVLMNLPADAPEAQAQMAAFVQGLQGAGWEVGRNLRIESRWGGGDLALLRKNAADLVALNPDVILAGSGPTTPIMIEATRTVPIVFAQSIDPVGSGSISSLARPGGNATAFFNLNTTWPENGWNYSRRLRRTSNAWVCCGNPIPAPLPASGPSSRHSRVRQGWS